MLLLLQVGGGDGSPDFTTAQWIAKPTQTANVVAIAVRRAREREVELVIVA